MSSSAPPSGPQAASLEEALSPYLLDRARDPVSFSQLLHPSQLREPNDPRLRMVHIGRAGSQQLDAWASAAFREPATAELLRDSFRCFAVDADEAPDWARWAFRQSAVLGRGPELPLQIFALPDGRPFFACGALPTTAAEGQERSPWMALLEQLLTLAGKQPEELARQADEVKRALDTDAAPSSAPVPDRPAAKDEERDELLRAMKPPRSRGRISESWTTRAARLLHSSFDPAFGGFGSGGKSWPGAALQLLLARVEAGDDQALTMLTTTLDGALSGALFDQLDGGLFTATLDRAWKQPVLIQRLDDNVGGLEVLLAAYQLTSHEPYREAAARLVEFLLRDLSSPEGGFFHERRIEAPESIALFALTTERVRQVVSEPAATHFCHFYGIEEQDDATAFSPVARRPVPTVAAELGVDPATLAENVRRASALLSQARRAAPAATWDDRCFADENLRAVVVLLRAALVLSDGRASAAALKTLRFWGEQEPPTLRVRRHDHAVGPATALDEVCWARALLAVHETTGAPEPLARALDWARSSARALPPVEASADRELALSVEFLRRLAVLTSESAWWTRAVQWSEACAQALRKSPLSFLELTAASWRLLRPALRIRVAPELGLEELESLRAEVVRHALPSSCFAANAAEEQAFALSVELHSADEATASLHRAREEQARRACQDLSRRRLVGHATEEGTRRRLERLGVLPERWSRLASCYVSQLGLGSYRIGLDREAHRDAARAALSAGCNLVDTSPSFALGDAERLLGDLLFEMSEDGSLARDEVVLMSKVGVFVGQDARRLRRLDSGDGVGGLVLPLSGKGPETLQEGAFSLAPTQLEAQVRGSLERLGVDTLDVCVIQSPEHLLQGGASRKELHDALQTAFRTLQELVERGWIRQVGVLCNTLVGAEPVGTEIALEELQQAAEEAGNDRFSLLLLPLNLGELRAIVPTVEGSASLVERALELGLQVVATRPLSVLSEHSLLRLVDPEPSPDSEHTQPLNKARYRVASLEAEFETTFAAQLRLAKQAGPGAVLPLSGPLGKALEAVRSIEQFELVETTLLSPRLRHLLGQLDRAFSGSSAWSTFRTRYVQAIGGYLASLREEVRARHQDELERLADKLTEQPLFSAFFQDRERAEVWGTRPWAERALLLQTQLPGVAVSLVGLRHPAHVAIVERLLRGESGS